MDFGLFLEFPCREGMAESNAFAECFRPVDEAESQGVASVWHTPFGIAQIKLIPPTM